MRPSPSLNDLRPMALGELIDRSAAFWRANLGALIKLYVGFMVAQYVVLKAYSYLILVAFPFMRGGEALERLSKSDPFELMRQLALALGLMLLLLVAYLLIAFLAAIAGCHFTGRRLLGEPVTLADSARHLVRRLGTSLVAFTLSLLWGGAVCVLAMVPGFLLIGVGAGLARGTPGLLAAFAIIGTLAALGGWVLGLLWYVLRFLLVSQVLAMEDLGVRATLRRAGTLISGRVGPGLMGLVKVRATVLITVGVAVVMGVSVLSGVPALILQVVYGANPLTGGDPYAVPQALLVPAELIQVAFQTVFGPLNTVFSVLLYVDMRMRREGLDLELRLTQLEQTRQAA